MNYPTRLAALIMVHVMLMSFASVSQAGENRFKISVSQAEKNRFTLKTEHENKIIPYTYLPVRLTITNRSEDKILARDRFPDERMIRTRIENDVGALIYEGSAQLFFSSVEREPGPPVRIAPGESSYLTINLKQAMFGRGLEGIKPFFRDPGVYHISFQYPLVYRINPEEAKNRRPEGGERKRETVKSESKKIRVLEMENYRESLQAVRGLTHSGLLIRPEMIGFERDKKIVREIKEELRRFLSEHSQSPWVPYAYHALGVVCRRQGRDNEEKKEEMFGRALEMFENALESAEKHEEQHLRFEIMESKGRLLMRLGERDKALKIRNQLLEEKREWKGLEPEPEPEPERDEHPLEARKRLERRIEELEAEGYDPTGMREHAPEAWEEYFGIQEEQRARVRAGDLLRKDYYDKMASVLQRLTREHLEPMEQDALRKQIEERERRREIQRRERREERQRWREENPEEYIEMLRELQKEAEKRGMKMEIDEEYIREKLSGNTEE